MPSTDFVSRFAPHLALPQPQSAGITGPDQPSHYTQRADDPRVPYGSDGIPLPYIQHSNGINEYGGTPTWFRRPDQEPPGFGSPSVSGPVPPVTPPIEGLRGLTPPETSVNTPAPPIGGLRGRMQPDDGLRGRMQPDVGLRDRTQPDPEVPPTQNILEGRRYEPGTPLRIPPMDPRVLEDRIVTGIQTGRIDPITPDRVARHLPQQEGTLEQLLSQFNFRLHNFTSMFDDQLSGSPSKTLGTRRDYIANANNLGAYPDFNTNEGLSEFNRRMNLNIGPQVRSQAEQAALVSRGYTSNPVSWHTSGRAADIRPRDIGGLTGQAAVNEVRRRLTAAGYQEMQVIWESGRGRHQGTGPHVHIEPQGTPY